MKYKVLTLAIAFNLAACGSEDASNVNSVIDNLQDDEKAESEEVDEVKVETKVQTPQGSQSTTTTTTTTTVQSQPTVQVSPLPEATAEAWALPDSGVLSFRISQLTYDCSDFSYGTAPGSTLELDFAHNDGMIQFGQSERQLASSTSQVANQGVVLSRSLPEGWVADDGSFTAMSSTIFQSYDDGRIEYSYFWEGYITESGWSGEYTMYMEIPSRWLICEYNGFFTGSWKD